MPDKSRSTIRKKIISCLALTLIAVLTWGGYQYWSITKTGEEASPRPADVIVVLGAAVWPQGPSPALQARVQHAVELFNAGYADKIILSGGLGEHPPSEAKAMQAVMLDLGVAKEVMHLEKNATSTVENLKFSKEIMEKHGWQSAIIVSDFFHLKRALLVAKDLGMEACGAPAKNSVLYMSRRLRIAYTLREILALGRYYLLRLL